MNQIYKSIFLVTSILFLLCVSSCDNKLQANEKDEEFVNFLIRPNVKDINESIKLGLDPFAINALNIGEMIYLEAVNQSNSVIYFPANTNIQVFRFDDNTKKWIEIGNTVNYYGEGVTTVPKGNKGIQSALVTFLPNIDSEAEVTIRVAVTGFVEKNGSKTDEAVSAYLDLTLIP